MDQEICIFSDVKGRRLWPESNMNLKVMENDQLVQDEFSHEQYVVISDEGQNVLISGCAHNGILNILDKYVNMFDDVPDIVISGFHMVKKGEYTGKDIALIKATAAELSELDITYYTGHCTGEYPMAVLSSELGDKLKIIHSGDVLVQ